MLASATANFAKMINLVVIFLTAHHSQKVDLTNYLANVMTKISAAKKAPAKKVAKKKPAKKVAKKA